MNRSLLTLIFAGLGVSACSPKGAWTDTELCMDVADDASACPAAAQVDHDSLFSFGWCETDIRSVDGEGDLIPNPLFQDTGTTEATDLVCCYPANARDAATNCAVGRAFYQGGCATEAPLRPGSGWSDPTVQGPVDVDWLAMARMEHASIASFARLTLDLLSLGAPAELLAQVQAAAADEVQHARLCFSMANAGQEPGPLPIQPYQPASMAQIADAAVREGCLGETLGAALLARAARRFTGDTRTILTRIARDECRHAALSWRIVDWLLEVGDEEVAAAVRAAFGAPFPVSVPDGLVTSEELEVWTALTVQDVIEPAKDVLSTSASRPRGAAPTTTNRW